MANQNSAMWLLIMAGILVAALPIGMNMLVGLDETVTGLQAVREQIGHFYEGATVSQRLDPPPGQQVPQGQKRTRFVIANLPTSADVLADPKQAEDWMNGGLAQLRRFVSSQEALAAKVDYIQVDLWLEGGTPAADAKPAFSKRREFIPQGGLYQSNPGAPGVGTPGSGGPAVDLLLGQDGSIALDGKVIEFSVLEKRLRRLASVDATVRLRKETGQNGKLSEAAEQSMHRVLGCVMEVGIGLEVVKD